MDWVQQTSSTTTTTVTMAMQERLLVAEIVVIQGRWVNAHYRERE